jgi:hypothetical protein
VQTWPMRIRFAIVWKYCDQQWFQNLTQKHYVL